MNQRKYIRDKRSPVPSSEVVSKTMSAIKAKNTKPEIKLRKALWSIGLRYRIHYNKLPGKPDIVVKKHKLAIFVDGEFWHGKDWEMRKSKIKSNSEFWVNKIERNMQRDREVDAKLSVFGYKVLRFWSLEIEKQLDICVHRVMEIIHNQEKLH